MVKKAFMKTVEILIVVIVTTLFMTVVLSREPEQKSIKAEAFLINIENNPAFRAFVSQNNGCHNSPINIMQDYVPSGYDYMLCINAKPANLPEQDVFVDMLFYAGNITNINYKIVRLYYWSKNL